MTEKRDPTRTLRAHADDPLKPHPCATQLVREIRRRRNAAGLSQRQLAQQIGYSRQYLSYTERAGGNLPSRDLVRALDHALTANGELLGLWREAKAEQHNVRQQSRSAASDFGRTRNDTDTHADRRSPIEILSKGDAPGERRGGLGPVLVPARIGGRDVYAPLDHHPVADDRESLLLPRSGTCADAGPGPSEPTPQPLASSRAMSTRLGSVEQIEEILQHLYDHWHLLVKTDNLLGPRHAIRGVLDQLQLINGVLPTVRENARIEIVRIAARYAESASWLLEDSGDLSAAYYWNHRALEWAHQVDDRPMVAWSLFRRSQQVAAAGDPAETIGLAQAAAAYDGGGYPSPMLAAMTQQQAHGHALDGDASAMQRALDKAQQWAASDTNGDARDGHGSFCTASYLDLQGAYFWFILNRPERAIQLYRTTLPHLPSVYRRDRGVALGRLAQSYTAVQEYEEAAQVASEALAIARDSGSLRISNVLSSVARELDSYRATPQVAGFLDEFEESRS